MKSNVKTPKSRRYTTAQVVAEIAKDPKARFRIPAKDGEPAYRMSAASSGVNAGKFIVESYALNYGWGLAFLPQSSNWIRAMPGSRVIATITIDKSGKVTAARDAAPLGPGKHVIRARKVDAK